MCEVPEPVRYALDNAAALARAPRAPRSHTRSGLIAESVPEPERCAYGATDPRVRQCRKQATREILTRSQRRGYCGEHFEAIAGELQGRSRRSLGGLVDWL